MPSKIIRDPLYNYISIDSKRDQWLIELLDTPEVQRLRRIHQLGVSDTTYPGASQTRMAHTLGVLHLMQRIYERIEAKNYGESVRIARSRLLAAAILHDVGHGPFSHLFEPCLGTDHEEWSVKIIRDGNGEVHKVLRSVDTSLPDTVAALIEKDNSNLPQWQKSLLSSQLDVDRMDYLRRDSLFTGAGYGHFDWFRLINTLELHEGDGPEPDVVWPEKAKFAIEEYIFARYYMYQNVYLHKTTRGMEKLLEAMWKRARSLRENGTDVKCVPAIGEFWSSDNPSVEQYLSMEEFTVLQQIQEWQNHSDDALSDLARRFMNRDRFTMIQAPSRPDDLEGDDDAWAHELRKRLENAGCKDPDTYCLRDRLRGKYNQPYFPEKQSDEQSARTAIRIRRDGETKPVEISTLLPRLDPITKEYKDRYRYYIPREYREVAEKLNKDWPL